MNTQQIIQNLIPILEAYIADESLLQPRTITRLSLPIAWLTLSHLTAYLDQHPDWQQTAVKKGILYDHKTIRDTAGYPLHIWLPDPDNGAAASQAVYAETAVNVLASLYNLHPYQVIIDLYKAAATPAGDEDHDESGLYLSPDEMARLSSNMRGMS